MGLFTRAIRPPDDITPNPNDPADVQPATVGPPSAEPGDPNGLVFEGDPLAATMPPMIVPSAWSGWPEWWPPNWGNQRLQQLTDTAWACIDLNASLLATMPPYLVGAADSLDTDWLRNPQPATYASWDEFAKQLFWDFQLGEAFVLATARYATGWPARFHVVPPWAVDVEIGDDGTRYYAIGREDVTADMLHLRYQSTVDDAHGHGPLEAGSARLVAADVLHRYATNLAASGGVPPGVLEHPEDLTAQQSSDLQNQWVAARMSQLGLPAVLSGGITWKETVVDPARMALLELAQHNDSRICVLLGVPPFLMGLPSGGDSMTYSNVSSLFDYHWRAGLRPRAQAVMDGLSEWLVPRGTSIELNRDAYVQPGPKERAETWKILSEIADNSGPVMTVAEIRAAERLGDRTDLAIGVPL